MGLSRHRSRIAVTVLAAALAAIAVDTLRLHRADGWNAAIAAGRVGPVGADAPAEARFAHAVALAASASDDEALQRYRALQDDPVVGRAARLNAANLLMRRAFAVRAGNQPGEALPLIELAKEGYRELLRADSQDWDARYDLERAQRLLPDPDDLLEPAPPETKRDAERAATTMRGYSPGLP
jgi:mxaK protein